MGSLLDRFRVNVLLEIDFVNGLDQFVEQTCSVRAIKIESIQV